MKIIIAGAGVSGIYTAICIKRKCPNAEVMVIEANDTPLKKLLATGNGRCNLSHRQISRTDYEGQLSEEVIQMMQQFDIEEALKELGLATKWIGDLLYPVNEQAKAVKAVLMAHIERLGIDVKVNEAIEKIYEQDGYQIVTKDNYYECDNLVLSMGTIAGGQSTSLDRHSILGPLHLSMQPFKPMLTKMVTKENVKSLKGTRVKGQFTLIDGQQEFIESGELLFTDYGVSGIAIMNLSRYFNRECVLEIDLVPSMTKQAIASFISTSPLENPLDGLLPMALSHYLTKHHLDDADHVKHFRLTITGIKGAKEAQVMKGGIRLKQLNDHLEFKNHPHLYATGELLDVTGRCGGYNLHFAFASASRVADALVAQLNQDK